MYNAMNIKKFNQTVTRGNVPKVLPKLNRSALARASGLSRVQVSRILSGQTKAGLKALTGLARALDTNLDGVVKFIASIHKER